MITLEIDSYGMNGDTLAEHRDQVKTWDVMLSRRNDETGEIDAIEEHEDLTEAQATDVVRDLERRFPDAVENEPFPC